jgi:hypothetical protein
MAFKNNTLYPATMVRTSTICLGLILSFFANPILAGERISIEEFSDLTTGKTFDFYSEGIAYGVERYWPNRRVEWIDERGHCLFGDYYEWQDKICFDYNDWGENAQMPPQCWEFERDGDQIIAYFFNPDEPRVAIEMKPSPDPLACAGPEVGA